MAQRSWRWPSGGALRLLLPETLELASVSLFFRVCGRVGLLCVCWRWVFCCFGFVLFCFSPGCFLNYLSDLQFSGTQVHPEFLLVATEGLSS